MDERVIFLRKKIDGENSIEGYAQRVADATGAVIKVCPYDSTTLIGMLRNIKFARNEHGRINHIAAQTESYLVPFLKGKRIVTFHDFGTLYASRNFLYGLLKILVYVKTAEYFSDAITFVSKQTEEEFLKQKWKKIKNLHVIYNSYDERLVPNDKSNFEPKPVVLQIGTGVRKNLESTIRAMEGINAKLLVIGKLNKNQLELLKEYEIDYENAFDITYEKIVDCYNRAKLVVFPTFYEGFGLPIIEANIMQKPIISSDLPIVREVGLDAVYYINPNRVEDISNALKKLFYDNLLYERYVELGIKNARRFSKNVIFSQYSELYRSLENE